MISVKLFKNFIFSRRAGALIKRLSWISLIQIVLSLFAFVFVLSVMNGMNTSMIERVNALEPDLTLEVDQVRTTAALEIQPVITRLRENPDARIEFSERSDVILRTMDGYYRGLVAKGVSEEAIQKMRTSLKYMDEKQESNVPETLSDWTAEDQLQENEILIGLDVARTLNVFEGDWLTVIPPEALLLPSGEIPKLEKVRVKKIITTSLQQLDTQYIWYVKGKALTKLASSPSRRVLAEVKLSAPDQAESLKKSLAQFEGTRITTWKERNGALFAALRLEKMGIGFILFLAGIISSFSVVMALSLLITQKEKEWALLRALGLSSAQLQTLILKLGMWLSGVGILSGVGLGTFAALWVQFFPISILPNIYYDSQIPAQVDFGFVFLVLLLATVLCYWTCRRVTEAAIKQGIAARIKSY